jgi:2-phospho-L-lactate guanylyltransferase
VANPIALIPLNDLSRAKGRLAEMLSPEHRVALASATFAVVVSAAVEAGLEVVVLAANPPDAAGRPGVRVLPERAGLAGLNPQLEAALAEFNGQDLMVLHADLPLATAAELTRMRDAAPPARSATLVESRDGGTNVMLMRPAGAYPLHYGPRSFALHVAAARAAGMEVHAVESETLSLDLDTPEDVDAFLRHPAAAGSPVAAGLQQMLARRA